MRNDALMLSCELHDFEAPKGNIPGAFCFG